MLSTGPSDVDYLMDFQHLLPTETAKASRSYTLSHLCASEDVNTSSFETERLESKAGNCNHARWGGEVGGVDTSLSVHMIESASVHVEKKDAKLKQQGNQRDGILRIMQSPSHTHTHTLKNILSVKVMYSKWLLVTASTSERF